MPGASIVEIATGTGAWGGRGTTGYSILNDGGLTFSTLLPPEVTAIDWGTLADAFGLTAGDDRAIRKPPFPGGTLQLSTNHQDLSTGQTFGITAASSSSRYRAWLRIITSNASDPRAGYIRVYNADRSTLYATSASIQTNLGAWVGIDCEGSVRIDLTMTLGSFPRWQGMLFDPYPSTTTPGRLVCLGPGRTGLVHAS